MKRFLFIALVCIAIRSGACFGESPRNIPQPLPSHPGNVFLAGEEISIATSNAPARNDWRLLDYDHKQITQGISTNGVVRPGKLPAGYYELIFGTNTANKITLGVIEPLKSPTPRTSPIGIDVAMAWFYSGTQQEAAASLCALAGANWVRDRLAWAEMEPHKGEFAPTTKYDDTARKQSAAQLQILQVHHNSPGWANDDLRRQPLDLRDAYRFMKEMASRWTGQVSAFEPWNEADIEGFGGHTGSEMAALQKASYLGLKDGDPTIIACQNVFATPNTQILADLESNEVAPYFDTFNLHHYCTVESYPNVYGTFRPHAAGKPMWVTEFNDPVKWSGDPSTQEPAEESLRVQAERVAKVFAAALHEGPAACFYFMLPHYCEGETQFGILHRDLTPRPAYVAFAAVGRLLADAKPAGQLSTGPETCAYVFHARPDGQQKDVVVAWAKQHEANIHLKTAPTTAFDHLGRRCSVPSSTVQITSAPLFLIFDPETLEAGTPPPGSNDRSAFTAPCKIVLQPVLPREKIALNLSAYRVSSKQPEKFPLYAYNFGTEKVQGRLSISAPSNRVLNVPDVIELAPGERKELPVTVNCDGGVSGLFETVKFMGDFGKAGTAVASIRLMPEPLQLRMESAVAVAGAENPDNWTPLISGGSDLKITKDEMGGVSVIGKLGPGDRWIYPVLKLPSNTRPSAGCRLVAVTLTAKTGKATYRAIFDEENGSSYTCDLTPQPKPGETVEAVAVLSTAIYGSGWSKPDDNGKLDPDKIRSLKIGCNTSDDAIGYSIQNIRWIKAER